ncbi:pirin family protein [Myxococcota bacterium]|nr:pirin family protein [Myxococcota bacterium]
MSTATPRIIRRPAAERGHFDHGWLDTWHSFSFAGYMDPRFMGFRNLRVINEDFVAAGAGFPTHPHRDMEIVTYVVSGAVAHKDSMGNGSTIRPGEIQRMTAGTGITHSEFNPLAETPLHLLQIWILPPAAGLKPSYEQLAYTEADRADRLHLLASPEGSTGGVKLNADARIYTATLRPGAEAVVDLAPGRHAWVQVVKGAVTANGEALRAGDGAALIEPGRVVLGCVEAAEVLVFDLM